MSPGFLPPGEEAAFLAEFGMEADEVLMVGGPESLARYLTRPTAQKLGRKGWRY